MIQDLRYEVEALRREVRELRRERMAGPGAMRGFGGSFGFGAGGGFGGPPMRGPRDDARGDRRGGPGRTREDSGRRPFDGPPPRRPGERGPQDPGPDRQSSTGEEERTEPVAARNEFSTIDPAPRSSDQAVASDAAVEPAPIAAP